ncbi:MAG: hypothetical protein WCT53_03190 [Candidatus Gracilibacteria bacterium]
MARFFCAFTGIFKQTGFGRNPADNPGGRPPEGGSAVPPQEKGKEAGKKESPGEKADTAPKKPEKSPEQRAEDALTEAKTAGKDKTEKGLNAMDAEQQKLAEKHMESYLKKYRDLAKETKPGEPNEELKKALEKAQSIETSVFKLQSGMKFSEMSAMFLKEGKNFEFTVDLKGDTKFELNIGLGHILPPSVKKVRVTDDSGIVREGTRQIHGGGSKVGYYDENGYIPVFSGYKVQVLETMDENSTEVKQIESKEKEFYSEKKLLVRNESWRQETIDDIVRSKEVDDDKFKQDWTKISEILLKEKIKMDAYTSLLDGSFLRSFNGEAYKLLDEKTVKLIKQYSATGYEFRIADLSTVNELANDKDYPKKLDELAAQTRERLKKGPADKVTLKQMLEAKSGAQGAKTLDEVRALPLFRRRVAENGLQFKTPDDYIRAFRNFRVEVGKINPDLYRDGEKVGDGKLKCAWYISQVLGLKPGKGFSASAPQLFAGLVNSGGNIVPEAKDLQPGDVVFYRGTYNNLWHGISHIGIVVGRKENGSIIVRHHTGEIQGVVTKEMDTESQKFYAGVRNPQITAQLASLEKTRTV